MTQFNLARWMKAVESDDELDYRTKADLWMLALNLDWSSGKAPISFSRLAKKHGICRKYLRKKVELALDHGYVVLEDRYPDKDITRYRLRAVMPGENLEDKVVSLEHFRKRHFLPDPKGRPEIPEPKRMRFNAADGTGFESMWTEATGKFWPSSQTERWMHIRTYWTTREITTALEETAGADYPGWKFFKVVLENMERGGTQNAEVVIRKESRVRGDKQRFDASDEYMAHLMEVAADG